MGGHRERGESELSGMAAMYTPHSLEQHRFIFLLGWMRAVALLGSLVAAAGALGCAEHSTTFPLPPVTVIGVFPAAGPVEGGTHVTIRGTNFANVTGVTVGGNDLLDLAVVNSTQITGTTPYTRTRGPADVVVTSASNDVGTCTGCFMYLFYHILEEPQVVSGRAVR